jgi:hypothetical protein
MRRVITISLLLLAVICARAQGLRENGQHADSIYIRTFLIGLEAGYVTNYLITNISNLSFTRYEAHGGYTTGVPIVYNLNSWFALSSNPGLVQKNYTYSRSGFFEGIRELHTNTYIQLPLLTRFSFGGRRLKGFVDIGVYGAYWAWGHISGSEPNILDAGTQTYNSANPNGIYDIINRHDFNQKYDFNAVRDNRFEFGGILGLGMRYEFDKGFQVFVEGKKIQSITDQQKKYMINQVPRYNSSYAFTFGVMIDVNHFRL